MHENFVFLNSLHTHIRTHTVLLPARNVATFNLTDLCLSQPASPSTSMATFGINLRVFPERKTPLLTFPVRQQTFGFFLKIFITIIDINEKKKKGKKRNGCSVRDW